MTLALALTKALTKTLTCPNHVTLSLHDPGQKNHLWVLELSGIHALITDNIVNPNQDKNVPRKQAMSTIFIGYQ